MLLRSFLWVMSLRLLSVALTLLQIALVTLWVSPAEYGRYSLVLSVALVLATAFLSWPNQATLRYGREDYMATGSFGGIFFARLALQMAVLLLILPLLALAAPMLAAWLQVEPRALLVLLALVLLLYPAAEFANVGTQIVSRYLGFGLSPVIQRLAQLAVLGAAAFGLALDWQVLVLSNIVGYLLALLVVGVMIPKHALQPLRIEARHVRRLLAYSWAMPLASLSAFVMSQMDLWFLRHFLSVETVGQYAWAYNVSLLATGLLVPLSAVLAPRSIDLHVGDRMEELGQQLRFCHALLALAAALMPLALGMLIWMFHHLPLGAYAGALAPLLVLAAGTLFQMGMALMEPVMFSHQGLVTRTVLLFVLMALLNALLDVTLIPPLGMVGPALATATVFAVGMWLEWRMLARLYADGRPRLATLRFGWTVLPMLLLWPLLKLTPESALLLAAVASLLMLLLGRQLGWLSGLGLLTTRLWPRIQPAWGWLAHVAAERNAL